MSYRTAIEMNPKANQQKYSHHTMCVNNRAVYVYKDHLLAK